MKLDTKLNIQPEISELVEATVQGKYFNSPMPVSRVFDDVKLARLWCVGSTNVSDSQIAADRIECACGDAPAWQIRPLYVWRQNN